MRSAELQSGKPLDSNRTLLVFKLIVLTWCGLLSLTHSLGETAFNSIVDDPFWWKFYSVLTTYCLASIVFRMGWSVPCSVAGMLLGLGENPFVGTLRCEWTRLVEIQLDQLESAMTFGVVFGLLSGIVLDHWWETGTITPANVSDDDAGNA